MEVSTWCEQLKIVISLVTCRKEMIISLFLWVPRYWKIYILHWTNFAKISALKFSFKIQKMYPPPQILQISLAFVIYLEHFPFFFFFGYFLFFVFFIRVNSFKASKPHIILLEEKNINEQQRHSLDLYPICPWKTETINKRTLQICVAFLSDIFVLYNVQTPRQWISRNDTFSKLVAYTLDRKKLFGIFY